MGIRKANLNLLIISILAMTEILCASFCSSVCGMFHFNKVTNECATFMEGYDDTGVELTSDPDWNVSYSENPGKAEKVLKYLYSLL